MRTAITTVAALCVAGIAANAGASIITLSFLDPAGGREVSYTGPSGDGTFGVIKTTANVTLQVDLSDAGLGTLLFPGLTYAKTAKVADAAPGPSGGNVAEVYDCQFAFVDGGGHTVLSGGFGNPSLDGADGGNLTINGLSGALASNTALIGGSLHFGFGDAPIPAGNPGAGDTIAALLAANSLSFDGAIDANWSLSGFLPAPKLQGGQDGKSYFASFESNSAFSATGLLSQVPSPASAVPFAMLALVSRRRRSV